MDKKDKDSVQTSWPNRLALVTKGLITYVFFLEDTTHNPERPDDSAILATCVTPITAQDLAHESRHAINAVAIGLFTWDV